MDLKDYHRFTEAQLKGRRARLLSPVRNGFAEIAAGTVVVITGKRSGFAISSEKCAACGVRVFATRVQPSSLELLPSEA